MRLFSVAVRGLGLIAALALCTSGGRGTSLYGLDGPISPRSETAKLSAQRGFDLSNLDPTCQACEDFAQFATGGWKKANPIPPDRTNWARFIALQQQNQTVVRGLLEDAARGNAPTGTNARKAGAFYKTCTARDARNRARHTP